MQTFLPYADFRRCAEALDDRRLGKQRVEVLQILRALELEEYGWRNHPAVRMWQGCTPTLVDYGLACTRRWVSLGHADTTAALVGEFLRRPPGLDLPEPPPWLGWEALHRSHRLALYGKDPDFYGARFSDVAAAHEHDPSGASVYVWPEPPAPRHEPGARSAWVAGTPANLTEDVIALPVASATQRRGTKASRMVDRFLHEVCVGDRVVAAAASSDTGQAWANRDLSEWELAGWELADRELQVGRIATPARLSDAGTHHLRGVAWERTRRRGDLRRPAQLQDPRPFFALHDEPSL